MKFPKIILASASPRRLQILQSHGFDVIAIPAHIEEILQPGESAQAYVTRLAKDKAEAILNREELPTADLILAADTTVVCHEEILEKPIDEAHAKSMLHLLSDTTHEVFTGYTLIFLQDKTEITSCAQTRIYFHPLTAAQIQTYIDSGDPFDKAGAYGIQTVRDTFVNKIEGSYYNVMGLPIEAILGVLRQKHFNIPA